MPASTSGSTSRFSEANRSAPAERPVDVVPSNTVSSLRAATEHSSTVTGHTHTFYHYPARFAPEFARVAIRSFSQPGDWVADPFMGGGTTIVEALADGRRALGVDLNSLAWFVAKVKTTPLAPSDCQAVRQWAQSVADHLPHARTEWFELTGIRNLPTSLERFLSGSLELAGHLTGRQLAFARCALLRTGQWALDGREEGGLPSHVLAYSLPSRVEEMLRGLERFAVACRSAGLEQPTAQDYRLLLNRSALGMERAPEVQPLLGKVKLAVCSPPYPGVHVLYHRWQERGRRETPAPYWVANQQDGAGESYYTMGGRSRKGIERYYSELQCAFSSLRQLMHPDGLVIQLVAFPNAELHLPRYLQAMEAAGYSEVPIDASDTDRLWRRVPNRKWYHRVKASARSNAAAEVVLIHRPVRASAPSIGPV
jgi:hypothetical protein